MLKYQSCFQLVSSSTIFSIAILRRLTNLFSDSDVDDSGVDDSENDIDLDLDASCEDSDYDPSARIPWLGRYGNDFLVSAESCFS